MRRRCCIGKHLIKFSGAPTPVVMRILTSVLRSMSGGRSRYNKQSEKTQRKRKGWKCMISSKSEMNSNKYNHHVTWRGGLERINNKKAYKKWQNWLKSVRTSRKPTEKMWLLRMTTTGSKQNDPWYPRLQQNYIHKWGKMTSDSPLEPMSRKQWMQIQPLFLCLQKPQSDFHCGTSSGQNSNKHSQHNDHL